MAQPVEGSSEDIQQDYAKNTATAAEIQKGVAQGIIKPTPTQEQQQEHGQYTTITPGKPVELPFGLTVSTQKPITGLGKQGLMPGMTANQQLAAADARAEVNKNHQNWQMNASLGSALQKAPYLVNHPELLWAIVHNQDLHGMVNPQDLAGILKAKSLYDAAMKSYAHQTYFDFEQSQLPSAHLLPGLMEHVGGSIQDIIKSIPGGTTFEKDVALPVMGAAGSVLGSHPLSWAQGLDEKAKKQVDGLGPAAIGPSNILGGIDSVLGMLNGLFSEPSHFYRYYETVKQLHGEDAALAATMPMIFGAGAGAAVGLAAGATPGAEEAAPELVGVAADVGATAADAAGATSQASAIAKAIQEMKDAAAAVKAAKENFSSQIEQSAAYERFLKAKMAVEKFAAPITRVTKPVTDVTGKVINKYSIGGAELGGQLGGQIVYPDIWKATQDGTKWAKEHPNLAPTFGQAILGRHNFASGVVDFLMSVGSQDPLGAAGSFIGQAKSAEGLGGIFNSMWSGTAFSNVDKAYEQYGGVKRSLDAIVENIDSPTMIARIDPRLNDVAGILSKAKVVDAAGEVDKAATLENVKDAFKQLSAVDEIFTTGKLPMSSAMVLRARMMDTKAKGLFKFMPSFAKFSGHRDEWGVSNDHFTLGDVGVLPALNNGLRHLGFNREIADAVTDYLYKTKDLGEWMNVYRTVVKGKYQIEAVKTLAGARAAAKLAPSDFQGFFEENRLDAFLQELDPSLNEAIDKATTEVMGYGGVNADGQYLQVGRSDLSSVGRAGEEGIRSYRAGVYQDDLGRIRLPNYTTFNKALHDLVDHLHNSVVKELDVPLRVALGDRYAEFATAAAEDGIVLTGDELAPVYSAGQKSMKMDRLMESMNYYIDKGQGLTMRGVYAVNSVVNDHIFKPLALATGGWATRVSASEGLLNAMRQGPINMSLSHLAQAGARHERAVQYWGAELNRRGVMDMAARINYVIGTKVFRISDNNMRWMSSEDEMGAFIATLHGVMAGVESSILKGLGKQEFMDAAIKSLYLNQGHIAPQMLEGGHSMVNDTSIPTKGSVIGQDTSAKDEKPVAAFFHRDRALDGAYYSKRVRISNDTHRAFDPAEDGFVTRRMLFANKIGRDPAMRAALPPMYNAYDAALKGGATRAEAWAEAEKVGVKAHYDFMQSLPEATRKIFVRQDGWTPTDAQWLAEHPGLSPEEAHSQVAIDGLKQLIVGPEHVEHLGGQYHDTKLFSDLANRRVANKTWKQFADTYHADDTGQGFPTGYFSPIVGGASDPLNGNKFSNLFVHFGEAVNEKMTGNIVTRLSREPVFIVDFARELKLLDGKVAAGILTQEQADTMALARASQTMIRFVHNPYDKLKFEYGMRIFAPFYFAQNQAWRRMARLGAVDIGAFERYIKTISQVLNYSYAAGQSQGGYPTVPVPGSAWLVGFVTKFLTGTAVPIGINLSLDSAQSVLPISPQDSADPTNALTSPSALLHSLIPRSGPTVNLPLKYLFGMLPLSPAVVQSIDDAVIGQAGESSSMLQDLLPNSFIDHLLQTSAGALGAAWGKNGNNILKGQAFVSSYITASNETWRYIVEQKIQSFKDAVEAQHPKWDTASVNTLALIQFANYYDPRKNGKAYNRLSDLMNEVNQATYMRAYIRSGLGFFSPLSSEMGRANAKVEQQYQNLVSNLKGDWIAAQQQWIAEDASRLPYTILTTTSQTSRAQGISWPETHNALQWMQHNDGLVNSYPAASRFLMPLNTLQSSTNPYYSIGALYQLQNDLRQRRVPEEMQQQIDISIGNNEYYNIILPYYTAQAGGNSYEGYKQAEKWAQTSGLSQNPDWYKAHMDKTGGTNRTLVLQQIAQMLNDPKAKRQPLYKPLSEVYSVFQDFANNVAPMYSSADRGKILRFGGSGFIGLDKIKAKYPDMTPFITDVLEPQYPYYPNG